MRGLKSKVEQAIKYFKPNKRIPISSSVLQADKDIASSEQDCLTLIRIKRVLDRRLNPSSGKVFWNVEISGKQCAVWVEHEEGAEWMFMEHNHDAFTEFLQVSQDSEIARFDQNNSDREDVLINDSSPEASSALPIEVDSLSVPEALTVDKVVNKQRGQKQGRASTCKLKNTKKRKTDVSANKDREDSNYRHNEENTSPEEDSKDYEITHIIGHRPTEDGRWEFSVRWKGFIMDSTTVYLEDLKKVLRILEAYRQVHPEIDKPPSSESLDGQESASMLAERFCPKRLNLLD
ncbi:hypothetical protein K435DRAFT_853449 [Dendrothele bispora CBS 962.96]|uniref:Chromo domain-containing protein n=1 Tax=Dendrothele bispora (strain CBS 962.96) TaxID=1314807 RepID=A0A4S8MGT9_DENBC|nr:hypothetical protein K435DRAFT_853449 [Dendrothele bispora CBS 962.96]